MRGEEEEVTTSDQGGSGTPVVVHPLPPGRGFHVKKLSAEDREDIVRAYLAGAPVIGLARQYRVDRAAIRHHLILRRIPLRGRGTR